jgi:hypothetical protein
MRLRLVSSLAVAAVAAAAVIAAVGANPAQGYPSKVQACTNCHPAAPASATVSATPSTTTPAAGATYTVTINLAGLTSTGDTGYWISNTTVTPAVSVNGGATGTSQTSYTQSMTAPTAAGTYTYTVWCQRGTTSSGQAKSTTYSITVSPPPAPTAAITSLTPNHAQVSTTVVIAGTNLGAGGTVRFGSTTAVTSAWSATSITCTVPSTLAAGATSVTVTPTGGSASNALPFTVDAATPPPPSPGDTGSGDTGSGDTTAPTTTATLLGSHHHHGAVVLLKATDEVGGSGVASITYSIDGGASVTVTGSSVRVRVDSSDGYDQSARARAQRRSHHGERDHTSSGEHSITYFATDAAGNVETAHTMTLTLGGRDQAARRS